MGLFRAARCANCERRVRGLPDARKEGSQWFCSQSCLLQAESSAGSRYRGSRRAPARGPVRVVRRIVKWTLIAVALIVAASVVAAIVGAGNSSVKHSRHPAARTARAKLLPRVVVAKIGFSQDKTSASSSDIDYGIVLANTSARLDARHVTVTVRAVDAQGRSITSAQTPITGIPAGQTFVIANSLFPNVSLAVKKLRATVRVGGSSRSLRLPRATNVRLSGEGELLDVTGRLRNPYRKRLPENTTLFAVLLNSQGRIVDATFDTTGAQVQPGATVSFDLEAIVNDPAAHPVSARVSIDPCFDFDYCAAP